MKKQSDLFTKLGKKLLIPLTGDTFSTTLQDCSNFSLFMRIISTITFFLQRKYPLSCIKHAHSSFDVGESVLLIT